EIEAFEAPYFKEAVGLNSKDLENKLKSKSKELATEIFSKDTKKLKEAQEALKKVKKPKFSLKEFKSHFKKQNNPYKNAPFGKRIIIGLTVESFKYRTSNVELAPVLGYRLNSKLSGYIGYLYRFSYDKNQQQLLFDSHTYGPRLYST